MKRLSENWLLEGHIDFEYKKYLLMAYLQEVNEILENKKLFPVLNDLIFHYNNLNQIKMKKKLMNDQFPKRVTGADLQKMELLYQKIIEDDQLMLELESIIEFAMPRLKEKLHLGKNIYQEFESGIEIEPIGIAPLQYNEGLMFLSTLNDPLMRIYHYQITFFERSNEKYRGIHTTYIDSIKKSLGKTYEQIKVSLIKRLNNLMPNPATFLVSTSSMQPFQESIFPVAKKSLVKYVASLSE